MRTLIVCIAVAGALGAQSARLGAAFFRAYTDLQSLI